MFCNILHFLTIMGYYLVLISIIDFKFNFMQTKFAMLAVSTPIACRFRQQVADFISGNF